MVQEKGYQVDYDTLYTGYTLSPNMPRKEITGYRVYSAKGEFAGLLDEEKVGLWYVDENSLSKKE